MSLPLPKSWPIPPAPAGEPWTLSIGVRGCSISVPIDPLPSQSQLDDAVWAALRRFNYDPIQFRGWVRKPAARNAIRVVVSG